jgi:hypothetical protein
VLPAETAIAFQGITVQAALLNCYRHYVLLTQLNGLISH